MNPKYNTMYHPVNNNDRFVFPFLTGALVGGAAVGLTRPRPIYNVAPISTISAIWTVPTQTISYAIL